MNTGGEAAEQIVRMSLEGFEVAAKITGAGAKNIAILLYSILKEEKKTKGKARLTSMLRSGKELKVNNNLISNAIRYATSKVNITYTSNNDGFYLSVSDNGCGFSKNILSKATNPYFTEEENHSEHFGLGLYICKILCEHHGGYLKIENCSIGAKVTAFFKSLD